MARQIICDICDVTYTWTGDATLSEEALQISVTIEFKGKPLMVYVDVIDVDNFDKPSVNTPSMAVCPDCRKEILSQLLEIL